MTRFMSMVRFGGLFWFFAFLALVPLSDAASAGVSMVPHRATYDMSLASARSGSSVAGIDGRMTFEWTDACDGWTIQQKFMLHFLYSEGPEMVMDTNYLTWEAKDGLSYHFNVRKLINGQLDEEVKGEATLKEPGAGGVARYTLPDALELELPPETLFPTGHTMALMDRLANGSRFFVRTVFDGADAEGSTLVSAVIGPALDAIRPTQAEQLGEAAIALLDVPGRAVRLAFFPVDSDEAVPDYEMRLELLENGIARDMLIDYGDFAVSARLTDLESVAPPGC